MILGLGELLDMYYMMLLSRSFEERVSTLYKQGRVQAGIFSGVGQEAITVGTCYGLEEEDFVAPAHRDIGVFLVKGVSPNALMAQLFARIGGLSKGKDSALHSGDPELNVFGSTSMVGSQICVATGAGLAFKMRGEPRVAVCYFGDGACSRGDFHEGLNFAGVHRLPVIFVCENNRYAYSTPLNLQMAIDRIAERATAYGFAGKTCNGNDLLEVWQTMREALYRARTGAGPTLIEWKSRDPIPLFERYLGEKKILTEAVKEDVAGQAAGVVAAAVEFAQNSPEPDPAEATTDVYAS